MPGYFGDVRDKLDALYSTAASFVHLPSNSLCSGPHVRVNVDLDQPTGVEQFRRLCYAYEESFDWARLPLVFDSEIPKGVVRWQQAATIVGELPIERALESFHERSNSLLERHE